MSAVNIQELLRLSVSQRIQIVEAIWDSITASPELLPMTDAQRQELDRRLADHQEHPEDTRSWEEFRDTLDEQK